MPFKTNSTPQALAGMGVLAAEGPQAAAFLQAQTMNDVAALGVGHWHWNGWLDARGRVLALFALLRTGEQAFRLLLPDRPAAAMREDLARFVFRTKVALAAADDWTCAATWDEVAGESPAAAHVATPLGDGAWALDASGDGIARTWWLLRGDDARLAAAATPADERWRTADLHLGLPRLADAQRGQWTPQMLSLQRLRAFSLKKGCFPGQEIVARTHYLGQAKRELALLAGAGALADGGIVTRGEGASAGTVVSATADGRLALAVLACDAQGAALQCGGAPVERIALADGLQRPR